MKATLISGAIRWVALGALVVFFGGASHLHGASQQQGDQTAVAAAVEQIWKEYSASLNAGELDRWLSLWTEDGVQMPPGEPPVVGKQRIRVRMQGVLGQFAFDITITNQEVAAADDWAYSMRRRSRRPLVCLPESCRA